MARPYPKHIYSEMREYSDQARLRFRIYRQANNWRPEYVNEVMGRPHFTSKFEKVGNSCSGATLLELVGLLKVDPIYLMSGETYNMKKLIGDRVEAIFAVGHTIEDHEVAGVLLDAGVQGFT